MPLVLVLVESTATSRLSQSDVTKYDIEFLS